MERCVIFLKRKKLYLFLELLVLFFIFVQYMADLVEEKRGGQAVSGVFAENRNMDAEKNTEAEEQEIKETLAIQMENENEEIQNIRVLLKTTGYKKSIHDSVKLVPTTNCTMSIAGDEKKTKTLKAGKTYTFRASSAWLKKGTVCLTPEGDGKIKVSSIRRACGTPAYRGKLEMRTAGEGILLINELPLEEYLYAVVPSEMPVSYGIESLKVQAVCARCYAYSQLGSEEMKASHADVDDSTSYQVYNNVAETPESIRAVDLTNGMVPVTEDGKMITAYYYSTSCGYTANFQDAWEREETAGGQEAAENGSQKIGNDGMDGKTAGNGLKEEYQYLQGKPQFVKQKEAEKALDLSGEENFRDFLEKETRQTFDSAFPWYRWQVSVSKKALLASVKKELGNRLMANPSMIEFYVNENLKEEEQEKLLAMFENLKAGNTAAEAVLEELDFGSWKSLETVSRSTTGMITCMKLTCSRVILFVYGEYNIRCLFAPGDANIRRQDGSYAGGLALLPSSFFYLKEKENSCVFLGGGYGHGVGMSQNGVKTMAEKGYSWEKILKHYYEGIIIKDISVL